MFSSYLRRIGSVKPLPSIHDARCVYEALPESVRTLAGEAARRLPVRMRYGSAYVAESQLILAAASSPELERQVAEERLSVLIRRAGRTPFWKPLLDEARVKGSCSTSFADLRRLPLLDKETVRGALDTMIDPDMSFQRRKYVTTGGTTGRPLGVWIDRDASPRDWAHVVSAWSAVGYRLDDRRVVLRGVNLGDGASRRLTRYEALRQELYVSVFDLDEDHLPEIQERVNRFGARYLHGYPSALEVLGRSYAGSNARRPRLDAIFAVSENLYPGQREHIESLFDAPVVSFYGMSEKAAFASECAQRNGYHVHEIYGHIEIVDEQGRAVDEPGVRGEIVTTGLVSGSVPLIRYRTGDHAVWLDGTCKCGRAGRRLGPIEGRWGREFLVTQKGSRIHMSALNLHSAAFDAVARFRFIQEAPGQVNLLVVPMREYSLEDRRRILREMDRKLKGLVEVHLIEVETLELSPRGKGIFIEQRLSDVEVAQR